jgi:hypothetical protein
MCASSFDMIVEWIYITANERALLNTTHEDWARGSMGQSSHGHHGLVMTRVPGWTAHLNQILENTYSER